MNRVYFDKGDKVSIDRYQPYSRANGLNYEAQAVTVSECGCSGGWDVFEGTNEAGEEVSFYGFSVTTVEPKSTLDP